MTVLVIGVALALASIARPAAAGAEIVTIAVEGAMAPGGAQYKKLEAPQAADAGDGAVAFRASVRGSNTTCIFVGQSTAVGGPVVCQRDAAPGGGTFREPGAFSINAGGTVVWEALVNGGGGGVFRQGTTRVLRRHDPVPGGGTLDLFIDPVVLDSGDVVVRPRLSGVPSAVNQLFVRCSGGDGNCSAGGTGTLETFVRRDDEVPDRPGRHFCFLGEFDASTWGIAFRALTKLDCADPDESDVPGIFRLPYAGPVATVALEKEAAASAAGGALYADLPGRPSINAAGVVAFLATVTRGARRVAALHVCDPAACPASPAAVAAEEGDADENLDPLAGFSVPDLSDAGDLVFTARAPRGGCGVYVWRASSGDIETVAAGGEALPDGGGILRCPARATISAGGTVAFRAPFKLRKSSVGIFLDR